MKKTPGFVMAEALMAVAALASGAVILSTVTNNAVTSTQIAQNYLVAQNLATEVLEAVKSVQETNSLRYPDDRNCWLTLDSNTSSASCGSTDQAAEGEYYLVDYTGDGWTLVDSGNSADIDVNGAASVQNKYRIYLDNALYRQGLGVLTNPTKYYRRITFPAINGSDSALIEVKLQWKEGQKVHTVTQELILRNYL